MPIADLRQDFPRLQLGNFVITSGTSRAYNCFAWAFEDTKNRWEPLSTPWQPAYWPPGAPMGLTIDSFSKTFRILGYEPCKSHAPEAGYQKIALYAKDGTPTHAARQLPSGKWTSKIGDKEDIQHDALQLLEGTTYGKVVRVFRRRPPSNHLST